MQYVPGSLAYFISDCKGRGAGFSQVGGGSAVIYPYPRKPLKTSAAPADAPPKAAYRQGATALAPQPALRVTTFTLQCGYI
jgi:hypothetical protein